MSNCAAIHVPIQTQFRSLARRPGFVLAVVLTLALGIGANSAVFSIIDAVILRPLPYPNPDRLVTVTQLNLRLKDPKSFVAPVRVEDWNRLNQTFQGLAGYYSEDASESSGTLPERLAWTIVSPGFFSVFGVSPVLGREFTLGESRFGGPNAAIISNRFWNRRFHNDPNVVGKRLRIDNWNYTIVGVMPASFQYPNPDIDIWSPGSAPPQYLNLRTDTWYEVVGRLKPGVSVAKAQADLNAVQSDLGKQFPATDSKLSIALEQLKETTVGGVRRSLWILYGAVCLLLLIACANVASLLLVRTEERSREISIRFSLGAPRSAVVLQLLNESLVLALAGSGLGLLIAAWEPELFRKLASSLPRADQIGVNWQIVLFTLAIGVVSTLIFGLFPALHATRREIAVLLAQTGRTQVAGRHSFQRGLVAIQIALAVVLLIGAGLLIRTFQKLGEVYPGFHPDHVLTLRITWNYGETINPKAVVQRHRNRLAAFDSIPGVLSSAISGWIPGASEPYESEFRIVGQESKSFDRKIFADTKYVSPKYFDILRIPILAGQTCVERSSDAGQVLVNRSFVNAYMSGMQIIGQHLETVQTGGNAPHQPPAEIVGVVGDARENGLNNAPIPTVYGCGLSGYLPGPVYLLRTAVPPMTLADAVRRKMRQIEPNRSVFDIMPLEQRISGTFSENRFRMILLTLFAVTALALAAVGLYGTMSYFVAQRAREIGLRMALGAQRSQILTRFLSNGLTVAFAGCAIGLIAAGAVSHLLAAMLYGVSQIDAVTFIGVAILIVLVATMAGAIPAYRATRVDPMQALREE